jgi:RNA polymerase sigma-54 factor
VEIKLTQGLHQTLVMTVELQQAIKLLAASGQELEGEINGELDSNPVLSQDEDRTEPKAVQPDIDWKQLLENAVHRKAVGEGRRGLEDLPPIEQNLTGRESLQDHLRAQLGVSDFRENERRFAELVLGNLDENGFLDLGGVDRDDGSRTPDLTLADLAKEAGLDPEDAETVLREMQAWEPMGCCVRDLRECLLVQAEESGCEDLEIAILDKHMHDLERHNYPAIARALGKTLEEVYEAIREIQKLESRPARNFSDTGDKEIGITPDVHVWKEDGQWKVRDNDRGHERLHINGTMVERLMQDPAAAKFVKERLQDALWLIRSIEHRRRTIVRVTEAIVDKQIEFFETGATLKPMILKDIAEVVGLHESTVSRVTSNKYVATPYGVFELKHFFNAPIGDLASESVRQIIKTMIDGEDKQRPISDQEIVDKLAVDGIPIARRTVAKYREAMGILASNKRKRVF